MEHDVNPDQRHLINCHQGGAGVHAEQTHTVEKKLMLKSVTRTCTLRTVFGLLGLLIMHPAFADGPSSYDDCMLVGLRDARSQVASNYIQRSCYALYRNSEMLLPREKAYYECILQNMPGAREQFAIMRINAICERRGQL
ncbi:VF_A0006 family four-cysteine protein [Paraburkholderia sp. BR10954]